MAKAKPRTKRRTPARKKPVEDWADDFLDAFATELTISAAAKKIDVGRRTVYDRKDSDAAFAEKLEEVNDEITEKLEREAFRRAVEGVDRPVFQGGEQVGSVRHYSDRMLEMLLRARAPDRYREHISVKDETEEALRRKTLASKSREEIERDLVGKENVIPISRRKRRAA